MRKTRKYLRKEMSKRGLKFIVFVQCLHLFKGIEGLHLAHLCENCGFGFVENLVKARYVQGELLTR